MPTTILVNEVSAEQRVKSTKRIKTKQQLLAKEVSSHKIEFRGEILISLNKDETWSADLIVQSSLGKNKIFLL